MNFINTTIEALSDFCEHLNAEGGRISGDKDKKMVFLKIQHVSCLLINIFASSFPSNVEYFESSHQVRQGKVVITRLKGVFILRMCKRIFLSEVWNAFEGFFQAKIGRDDKFGRELLKEYYGDHNKIPISVDFLRKTRNSLHNNGIYGSRETPSVFKTASKTYKLEQEKAIKFAKFQDFIDIIKECLRNL